MDMPKEHEGETIYKELENSLKTLVRSREDAYGLVWCAIFNLIAEANIQESVDCLGMLMRLFASHNRGSEIAAAVRDNTEWYQHIKDNYALDKNVTSLGVFWKELIREKKSFRLRLLIACLKTYCDKLVPIIQSNLLIWQTQTGSNDPICITKACKRQRATVKAAIHCITVVLDVISIQDE